MSKRLVDHTSELIVEYILKNDLKAGDRLPNEYDFAKILEVGRSTLRESVRALVSRNVLEVKQGSGTYVSQKMGISNDPLGFTFIKDTRKLTQDLFTLRYILEPEVAMLAAQKGTRVEMEKLQEISLEIEKSIKTTNKLHFELDIEFHSFIAKMSENIAMDHLIPVINQSITLYNSYYTNEQSKNETIESHREIVKSILERDIIRARYAMQRHISNNQRQLEMYYNKNTQDKNMVIKKSSDDLI